MNNLEKARKIKGNLKQCLETIEEGVSREFVNEKFFANNSLDAIYWIGQALSFLKIKNDTLEFMEYLTERKKYLSLIQGLETYELSEKYEI